MECFRAAELLPGAVIRGTSARPHCGAAVAGWYPSGGLNSRGMCWPGLANGCASGLATAADGLGCSGQALRGAPAGLPCGSPWNIPGPVALGAVSCGENWRRPPGPATAGIERGGSLRKPPGSATIRAAAVPADRLRLTLAHELGHMVFHTTTLHDDDTMEDEADEFAGAFLLPAEDIKPQLRRGLDLRNLANMKLYWKVSMAAIAVRADRLNLVTPYQKKTFWMEMGRLGYRKREPNEPPREEPKLLRQMVAFHLRKLGYLRTEMAQLLHLTDTEFEQMYSPEILGGSRTRAHLRLVR